jgi:copper(I)-binding protein
MKPWIFLLMLMTNLALATESTIEVSGAWVREAPPGAAMLAAYMKINNTGTDNRVLTRIESPRFQHVMLHQSIVVDGIAKMHHQDSLEIPAGDSLILEPGSYHLMMPAPDDAVQRDQCIEFTLHMKNGERITVNATVKRAGEPDS